MQRETLFKMENSSITHADATRDFIYNKISFSNFTDATRDFISDEKLTKTLADATRDFIYDEK
jgi:hypothetical protein